MPDEAKFRLGSYARIALPASNTAIDPLSTLLRLKEFLAAGMAVAFAGPVFDDFATLSLDQGGLLPDRMVSAGDRLRSRHGAGGL